MPKEVRSYMSIYLYTYVFRSWSNALNLLVVGDTKHLANGSLGLAGPLAGGVHVQTDVCGVHQGSLQAHDTQVHK